MHHDDVLGRLTEGKGRLDRLSAAELKRVPFRGSDERMMTLGELCDLVAGRVTILIELKSRFDGDAGCPRASRGARRLSRAGRRRCRSIPVSCTVLRQKRRIACRAVSWPPNTGRIHIGIRCRLDALRHGLSRARP